MKSRLTMSRIPALDGVRGVASLMVMVYHYTCHISVEGSPWRAVPSLIWAGVDLFFVLSGYLICTILLQARESQDFFKTFYIRRACRIFPLYYTVVVGYVLALWLAGDRASGLGRLFKDSIPVWMFLAYGQNVAMGVLGTFGPIWLAGTWSLAVEEQFYLLLPAVVRKVSPATLYRVAWGSILFAVVLRAWIQKFKFIGALHSYVSLPARCDSLAFGLLLALLMFDRRDLVERWRRYIPAVAFAVTAGWLIYRHVPNPQAIRLAFIHHTGNAIVFSSWILLVLTAPTSLLGRVLSTPVIREIGNMAYSTYLFHPIVLCLSFLQLRGHDPILQDAGDYTAMAAAVVVTLLMSFASWRFFEKPLIRIGHRHEY